MSMRRHVIPLLGEVLLTLGSASLLIAQTPDSAEIMFEAARQMELIDGDLDAAIEQYRAIVSTHPDRRAIVAEALLRMGSGYEKLGQARAREVYERLVREYPDQTTVLVLAREGLSRLTVESTPPSHTMTVRELMRSGEQRPGEVSEPTNDSNFAISGDGQILVYTDWETGDLATKNMATGEVRSLYGVVWGRGPAWYEGPVLSPDDKKVAYVRFPSRSGDTTRIDADSIEGGNRETVYDFKESSNSYPYDWSPDGETILISSHAPDRSVFLATLSLEDKTLQRLVTLDWEGPRRAQYSPDGRFIAYDSTKGGDRKIYLISADGSQESVLVDSPGEDDSPLWTRDGRFLLFRSNRSGKWDLYARRMQNGQPADPEVLIKANLGEATFLRGVTTEGQLVYFEQFGGRDIAITERIEGPAETIQVRILPKVQTPENKRPSFAPDGKRLAYLAGTRQSGTKIRITDLEGKILKEIPLESRFNTNWTPKFSPDGKKMALRVYDAGEAKIMVRSAETGALLNLFSPLGPTVVQRLRADATYPRQFDNIFGRPPDVRSLSYALATYVRTLFSGASDYDRYQAGETTALSTLEQQGLRLFRGRARCTACHVGSNFTDEDFHNTGVFWGQKPYDSGRVVVTGLSEDTGKFKTPTLREIEHTAPYMHDGSITTLEEVIEFYDRGGNANPYLDRELRRLSLTVEEKEALLAFLKSLSGQIRQGLE